MPFIIVSTATAPQIFIKRQDSLHATVAGKEIFRVEIAGGANLMADSRIFAETGRRVPVPENGEFTTTVVSDDQMDFLNGETSYQQMVENGYMRAVHISEREAANMKKHHLEAEVEHLLPVMAKTDGGRQLTADDFTGSLAKVKGDR